MYLAGNDMQIPSITIHDINSKNNVHIIKKPQNCSFKSALWQDEEYDESSIFYHMDKKDRNNDIGVYDLYRTDSGYNIKNDTIKKMRISSAKYIGNNCYKGGMTSASNFIRELKENGITKMIVLCDPSECNIEKACKENNMDWMYVYTPITFIPPEAEKDFLKEFSYTKFLSSIKSLQTGNVFIGCESGNLRTNRFLHAIKLLDPRCKLNLGLSDSESYDYLLANWIYKGLSSTHKAALNYTEEFEKKLVNSIAMYMPMKFRTTI